MIEYQKEKQIFIIRLDTVNSIEDVEALYREYRQSFEKNFLGGGSTGDSYRILLDGRKYSHQDFSVDRKIRELFDFSASADEKNACCACAIVKSEDRMLGQRKMQVSEKECSFVDECEALAWLCER